MGPSDVGTHTPKFDSGYPSPRTTRSPSISSDHPSSAANHGGLLSPPTSVSPDAAFIAVSAASQIVTNDHDSQSEAWLDQHGIEPSGETALVSPPALKLVNRFLDQLLFNFLSVSRSTSLAALRPAVSEVLKPKLAKGAISGADSELHEYLGGEEDEDLLSPHAGPIQSKDWDLELVWKRTRLRCMVYSSLGDMEEEEEDYYTEQEQLDPIPGSSHNHGVVSPAVAIFLTSILEFMGEQVLVVAGQAAYHRLRLKHERDEKDGRTTPAEIAERVVVEESDMERVALDRTLGRLWRGWKKRIRSPMGSVSTVARPFSRESTHSLPRNGYAPSSAPEEQIEEDTPGETDLTEYEQAARIPLPCTEDDVREIEIPGLARQFDEDGEIENEEEEDNQLPARPISFQFWAHPTQDLHEPTPSHIYIPKFITTASRKRSYSLPPVASKRSQPFADEQSEEQDTEKDDEQQEAVDEAAEPSREVDEDTAHPELPVRSPARRGVVVGEAGAAAVAVAVAAEEEAHDVESGQEDVDSEEDHEEPQIMTSSRVSIGGRISPDDTPAPSKRSSVRSHSVHSLRLIEVSSPTVRSRGASVDASDYPPTGRPVAVSTPGSVNSPILVTPHIASPVSQARTASPISRNGSSNSSRQLGHSTTASIAEAEEPDMGEPELGPESSSLPSHFAAAMQGVDVWSGPSAPQFTSAPADRDFKPQPSTFVLSPAPATRNARGITSVPVNDHYNQQSSALGVASKSKVDAPGIPPLTPLRELMEGAPDTSDEASSVAPSYDGQSHYERTLSGHSPSVSSGSLMQRAVRPHATSAPRGSPPRSSREENPRKDSRAQRPIHTSGSGSSSVSHKLKPFRSSEDSGPSVVEDKGKSFEQLIRSDQTIQYTLTPANMRDPVPDSPHSPRLIASPVRANFPNFPETPRPTSGRSHSSSVGKYGKPTIIDAPQPFKNIKATNGGSRLALNTAVGQRTIAPQPRDARVEPESTEDFAEFIKATGPVTRYESAPRSAPPIEAPRFNGLPRKSSADTSIGLTSGLPRRTDSSAGRMKLQAREAVVTRADGINDLIDFMRSGPQGEMDNPRPLRRAATDIDHLTDAVSDPRYSQTPTSVHSSVTSQSALLNGTVKMNKSVLPQTNAGFDEDDMMPKRKQRRVRDMYQIDFSDDEEEYEGVAGRPKPIQEESLADFLRNVPPPAESTTTPIFESAPATNKKVKRKSSTTGIMSRFSRNSQMPAKQKPSGQEARPGSRAESAISNHTPIAVQFPSNYKTSTNDAPRIGNYAPRIDPPRTKVVQKSYQPREAIYSTNRTNELAAFLRDSDPPSAMQAQPQTFTPTLQKDEASTFQRVFGRRKVH